VPHLLLLPPLLKFRPRLGLPRKAQETKRTIGCSFFRRAIKRWCWEKSQARIALAIGLCTWGFQRTGARSGVSVVRTAIAMKSKSALIR